MNSTTVRARLVIALLMIAGSFSVALVAESATAAPAFSVNLTVSNMRPDVGETVRLSGKVTPRAPGKRVLVQGKAAGTGWVTMSRPILSKTSTYKATVRFSRSGAVAIRIVKAKYRDQSQGISRVRNLRVGALQTPPQITTTSLPAGSVGAAYSATIETADSRPGHYSVAVGTSLPAGLSLHDQTGVISGSPTTQGTSNFTVVFRDPDGLVDSQALSITVGASTQPPVITTTSLPGGSVGAAYAAAVQTQGNKTGSWAVTVGTLPAGLTLAAATGVIGGTPTTVATSSFTVRFTETATGLSDTQVLSITIAAAGAPVISTTTLPEATDGTPYSATLQTTGNRTGAWAVTAGTLPAGLTLAAATGVISGTPTTAATSNFSVRFTETATGLTDTQALSIKVNPATPPVISTTTLPNGSVGAAYTATLQTVGNRTGTWARPIGSGPLPAGLTLNATTGVISGTPTAAGVRSFTVRFTQTSTGLTDSQALSITITAAQPPVISTTTLPNGAVGAVYNQTVQTVGNKTGTWAVTVGTLPAGLTLAAATGVISGTPTTAATSSFTVRFTETATGLLDTQALSITIVGAAPPVISTTTLPAGSVGNAYSATLQTVGNKTGAWGVTSGALPPGLALVTSTGVISGTPNVAGTSTFTVQFTQTGGLTDTQALSITVDPNTPPVISTTTLPGGEVATAYSATLQTVGNRTGTWSVSSGSLPGGLSLNGATGGISGTPTAAGTANFTVLFSTTGGLTDSAALSITVTAATAPVISTSSLPAGAVGTAYSATLQTVGNKPGTWSVSTGSLPAGLSLNAATGVINGTPNVAGTASFTVGFTAAVSGLTDSQALSIVVDPNTPPVISTTSLPGGTVATAYTATLQTVGNRTGTWSVSTGSLPGGLSLNAATGVISGAPSTAGTTNFTVLFTTTGGLTDSQFLSIAVVAAP